MRNFNGGGSVTLVISVILVSLFALAGIGCGDDDDGSSAIVGDWVDKEDYYGWNDNFEVESDLTGKGEFWIGFDGSTVYYCEYDLEIERDGDKWVFDAECDDDSQFDFEMECELSSDREELDCEGSDGYMDDWDWEFEKD